MTRKTTRLATRSAEHSNASVAYEERRNGIKAQLALLAAKRDHHAKEQAREPYDWGYVGDLGSIEKALRDINAELYPECEE